MDPENDPFQGTDLSQIDITDPETRSYVEQYVDLNDPETASFFGIPSAPQAPVPTEPKGEVKFWDEAKGPEQGPRLNPEQEGALREFYSSAPSADAINEWWKQRGFGGIANAEEVSRTLRSGGNVEGVNYGAVDNPRTKEDIGNSIADQVLADLGPQGAPTQTPEGAPVATAAPVLGFWEGVGQRAKEAFSEAGESLSGLAKREVSDARDEGIIRRWAQEQGFSPEASDAFVAQAYDRRSNAIREEISTRPLLARSRCSFRSLGYY